MGALTSGLSLLASPSVIGLMFLGAMLGAFVGLIPGLGGAVLLTLLLPFLFHLPVAEGVALIVSAHAGIYFSGSATAILINSPGAPECAATTLDGYPMSQKNRAAEALGISAMATALGGVCGVIGLVALIPAMGAIITVLKPASYMLLAAFAIILIGKLQSASVTKGILSGLWGMMISFVGYDPSTGLQRFGYGQLSLYNGVSIVAVALGLFAFGRMFYLYGTNRAISEVGPTVIGERIGGKVFSGVMDVLRRPIQVLRASLVGFVAGLIPGVGGVAANFVSYAQARATSKRKHEFGTGIPEGVIAPEASNLAKEAASYVPLIALGIPGTVGSAVILSAFTILGLAPGPSMVSTHEPVIYLIAAVLLITGFLASGLGISVARHLALITTVRGALMSPYVIVLGIVGAWAATTNFIQLDILVGIGVVGLVMMRLGYSLPAAIIGFLLGSVFEHNLTLTEQVSGWNFLTQPLPDFLLALVILSIFSTPLFRALKKLRGNGAKVEETQTQKEEQRELVAVGAASTGSASINMAESGNLAGHAHSAAFFKRPGSYFELAVDAVWVVGSAIYWVTAIGYPSVSRTVPIIVSSAAFVIGLIQFLSNFIVRLQRITHGKKKSEGGHEAGKVVVANVMTGNRREYKREIAIIAWTVLMLVGIWLIGLLFAVPLGVLAYFLVLDRCSWRRAVISGVAMYVVIYVVFVRLLATQVPHGII
ncbi:MAG: hypothetical protein EPN30_05270 [Actinomycetota bacterium]|nr:MAG: hypothetical protein EPN30_05270 [Actinomycetota bacterium]